MYNQIRFEKELQKNLTNKIENNADEENEIQKRLISFEVDVETRALNKSTDHRSLIYQSQPETKLKFNELYSFKTIEEMYKNVKILMIRDNSREACQN
jgi:hypothetical protein